jgi:drug/metabolite transporter (DMT)-like permease
MIGPLPTLHRMLLVLAAVGTGLAFGLWAGLVREVPVGVSAGIMVGVTLGSALAFVLVHDFHQRSTRPGPAVRRTD